MFGFLFLCSHFKWSRPVLYCVSTVCPVDLIWLGGGWMVENSHAGVSTCDAESHQKKTEP